MEEQKKIIVSQDESGNFTSIQAAIDAASKHSTISIMPGNYHESFHLTKDVSIIPSSDNVVIQNKQPITIEHTDVLMNGISFTGPIELLNATVNFTKCQFSNDKGIAITSSHSKLTISDCEVFSCKKQAMLFQQSNATVCNTLFYENMNSAICITDSSTARVLNSAFFNNTGTHIDVQETCDVEIEHCKLYDGGRGGVSATNNTLLKIRSSELYDNQFSNVILLKQSNAKIEDCRLHHSAQSGVIVRDKSMAHISNSEICDNAQSNVTVDSKAKVDIESSDLRGATYGVSVNSKANVFITNCQIEQNKTANVQVSKKATVELYECFVSQSLMTGVLVEAEGQAVIKKCSIDSSKASNLVVRSNASAQIENSKIHDAASNGISLQEGARIVLLASEVMRNKGNISLISGTQAHIMNSKIYGSSEHGIYNEASHLTIKQSDIYSNEAVNIEATMDAKVSMEKCNVFDSESIGLLLNMDSEASIETSKFYRNHYANIIVEREAKADIQNSQISQSNGIGLKVYEGGKATVFNTEISLNKQPNIQIESFAQVTITDCAIHDGFENGIFVRNNGEAAVTNCTITSQQNEPQIYVINEGQLKLYDSSVTDGGDYGLYYKNAIVDIVDSTIIGHQMEDIFEEREEQSKAPLPTNASALEKIKQMTGLSSLKEKLIQFIRTAQFMKMREERGLIAHSITLHSAFIGNSGTGKTTIANLLGQALFEARVIHQPTVVHVTRKDLVGQHVGATAIKTEGFLKEAHGGILFVDDAHTLTTDSEVDFGHEALATILKYMEDYRDEIMVIFAGLPEEMQSFLAANTAIASRIPNIFYFDDFSLDELANIGYEELTKNQYTVDLTLYTEIVKNQYVRSVEKGNARWIRNFNDKLLQVMANRVIESKSDDLFTIQSADLYALTGEQTIRKDEKVTELLAELDALIGLESIKIYVHDLVKQVKADRLLLQYGIYQTNRTYHMNFSGNPGTGKTTVAHIIAQLFYYLDILPKPYVRYANRTDLVGAAVGETEKKTKEVIKQALGGVLFIDEAYQLYNDSKNDYGKLAIETLLTYLENYRDKFIVILAGYSEEMELFLSSNPGLRSRIPNKIEFPDYTTLQLTKIIQKQAAKEWTFDQNHLQKVITKLYDSLPENERANGRWARHTFERLIHLHKLAIVDQQLIEERDIRTIQNDTISKLL